jgi:hypothetical protein
MNDHRPFTSHLAKEGYTLEVSCGGGKYTFALRVTGESMVYLDIDRPSPKVKNFIRVMPFTFLLKRGYSQKRTPATS